MKRNLILLVCLFFISIVTVKAQTSKVALQHSGNVTLYNADELSKALDASVDGDTLYLNEGTFTGGITIKKKVTIIGSGSASIISGDVTIAFTGTPTLTANLLDALNISGTINITSAVNGLKLRKCKFTNISFSAYVNDMIIDRCFCTNTFTLSTYVKGLTVINSKIYNLNGGAYNTSAATFINCCICSIYASSFSGTIMNSILYTYYNYNANYGIFGTSALLVNTLVNTSYLKITGCTTQNCMESTNFSINGSTCECNLTTDDLQNASYLGNDGTVVGVYGGTTPFTLVPAVPTVSSYKINVDAANKKLNVNLKVTAN